MMKKMAVLVAVAMLMVVGGCTNPVIPADRGDGGGVLFLETQQYGWVEIVAATPGTIHWGDSFEDVAYTQASTPGTYTHYFGDAGVYAVRMFDGDIVTAELTVEVPAVRGHVELVGADGLTITVRHYAEDEVHDRSLGFAERTYWIEWGDGEATTITSHEYYALSRDRVHVYAKAGTYEVAVRSPGQGTTPSFTVTVTDT